MPPISIPPINASPCLCFCNWGQTVFNAVILLPYIPSVPITELAADGVTVNAYMTWGPTGLLNRTNQQTNREIWYLFDPLGNVSQRLNTTGRVISSERYDAWGNPIPGGDLVDPYGWHAQQGYYTDPETGLLLCTHRYYDPLGGRWITKVRISLKSTTYFADGDQLFRWMPTTRFG